MASDIPTRYGSLLLQDARCPSSCAAGTLFAFVLACGGDDPVGPPDYSGSYTLITAAGGSVPIVVRPAFTYETRLIEGITGGRLLLLSYGSSCTLEIDIFFQTAGGLNEWTELNLPCSYAQAGSVLTLTVDGSVRPTTVGTSLGMDTITMDLGTGFGVVVFRAAL
jgi:hypothetical protein